MQTLSSFINESTNFIVKHTDNTFSMLMYINNINIGKCTINIDTATITYLNIDEFSRLNGYGVALLNKAIKYAHKHYAIDIFYATVKKLKKTSIYTFNKVLTACNFTPIVYSTKYAEYKLYYNE